MEDNLTRLREVLPISASKIGMIILLGWVGIILGGLTYLTVKKKDSTLISGFSNRPKEEQEQLKKNGYVDAVGKLLLATFIIYVVTYVLWIFSVPYSLEVGFSVLLLGVLVGTLWIQRYEVPHKRKKMYWIVGTVAFVVVVSIRVLTYFGLVENEVTIEDNVLVVSGMYGVEWELSDIQTVELLDELPDVLIRTNGFATEGQLKGRFLLEKPYEGGLLYVRTKADPPYLYVATDEDYFILNRKDSEETQKLYETIKKD